MLTALQPDLPTIPPQVSGATLAERVASLEQAWREDRRRLLEAMRQMWDTLNQDGALDIVQARITASHGIIFPATQNASTDVNTLDDYEEKDWSSDLALTFATPGDLSVTYSIKLARATKVGRKVSVSFVISTSAFTHTTAAGNLILSGLPYTSENTSNLLWGAGLANWQGITKANYTDMGARVAANSTSINVIASGSAQTTAFITAADMPTGGAVILVGELFYNT